MSERPVDMLIGDIWEALCKIERYTSGMEENTFFSDDKTMDAVVRNLEIIGEAANRLPVEFKSRYPLVEWPKIIGLRHRIVHDYFGIDMEIVWNILQQDLPAFKSALTVIRADLNLTDENNS